MTTPMFSLNGKGVSGIRRSAERSSGAVTLARFYFIPPNRSSALQLTRLSFASPSASNAEGKTALAHNQPVGTG
jgi:hypothetical protein